MLPKGPHCEMALLESWGGGAQGEPLSLELCGACSSKVGSEPGYCMDVPYWLISRFKAGESGLLDWLRAHV